MVIHPISNPPVYIQFSKNNLIQLDFKQCGGGERDRTDDLLRAKQVLSQLSYTPSAFNLLFVGLGRFELPTSRLSGVRSDQLSYRPLLIRPYTPRRTALLMAS